MQARALSKQPPNTAEGAGSPPAPTSSLLIPMLFVHPVYDAPHRYPSARETRCSAVSSLATGASARAAVRSEGREKRNEHSSSVRFRPSSVTTPRVGAPMVPVSVWQGRVSFPAQAGGTGVLMRQPMRSRHPPPNAGQRPAHPGHCVTCWQASSRRARRHRKPRSMRTTECASAEGGERMG